MKVLVRLTAIIALAFAAACGSQTNNPTPAPVGPGVVTPAQCAAGQVLTSLGCLPTDTRCQPTEGYNAATNQCVPPIGGGFPSVQGYAGQLSIVDRRQFEWYLNDVSLVAGSYFPSAFCENYGNVYGGGYPCSYFSSEGGIQIINQGGHYGVQVAPLRPHPFGLTTPVIPMRLFPTNSGTGFAFQQNSGFSLVQVVGRGTFGSTQGGIEVDVSYKGVIFGRGVLYPR